MTLRAEWGVRDMIMVPHLVLPWEFLRISCRDGSIFPALHWCAQVKVRGRKFPPHLPYFRSDGHGRMGLAYFTSMYLYRIIVVELQAFVTLSFTEYFPFFV